MRRTRWFPGLVLAGAAALVAGLGLDPGSASASTGPAATPAQIMVSHDVIAQPVSPEIVGANGRWINGELGIWDADSQTPDQKVVDMARQIRLDAVRYPGGTVANLFDWRKAIGPESERGCQVGGGFVGSAQPYDSSFGPDEQQKFVQAIGGHTVMMTPTVEASTEQAADFVEYMNAPLGTNPNGGTAWAAVRAANGHPRPYDITWWEVGNEPYNIGQRYWRDDDQAKALEEYTFGGTVRQTAQPVGTPCDHRAPAGVSNGGAGQSFTVWYPPVVPSSQVVYVDGAAWQAVSSLTSAGPDAEVYSFDPITGAITFGDGAHGKVPPKGAEITADYDSGPHPGFVDFYAAMKKTDPSIKVCSAWARPDFVKLAGAHPYDCLSPHLYDFPDVSGTAAQVHDGLMPGTQTIAQALDDLVAAERAYRPHGRLAALEVSEYGAIPAAGTGPAPTGWPGSVSWALLQAGELDAMIEHSTSVAIYSNLNSNAPTAGELFGGAPNFYLTSKAYLLDLYATLAGTSPTRTTVRGNPDASTGSYPALQVLSTRSRADGSVRVIVANRDRQDAVTARLHVGTPGRSNLVASTLNGPSFTSYNTAADDHVVETTTTPLVAQGPDFTYTFPAHSVTELTIVPAH